MNYILFFAFVVALSGCQFFGGSESPRAAEATLSQDYADERKASISDVKYHLQLDLSEASHFQGVSQVTFNLKQTMFLSLDFTGGEVQKVLVNGQLVPRLKYNGFFIEIPEKFQKRGANKVTVTYTHDFSKDGAGLYRYVDVKDQRTYLYSQFEPYDANRMFPCFDQPNLKATYDLQVLAPKDWVVISSVRESDVVDKGALKQWVFPTSAKFSTYTFSLHAGDYVVWEDVAKTKKSEIPLRLFARKSLAKYVKTDDWFEWTKQGFAFFENYYSYPYPYQKYDQLLVPDFNAGAMENVGAVTFNEDRFVVKGDKTREQRKRLAGTLFHEMAHMWFGNLVTMDWWNDLWLNESFATYSSFVGLVSATEFKEGWQDFNTRSKQRAYDQDQSVTTHPIAQDCSNTSEAFANFDAITYGKGASVMKQLSFYIGDKNYRKALKNYFEKHAEKNTVLSDFMAEMEQASGKDLKTWQDRWLQTAMLNEVEVHFLCEKGRVTEFEIYQTGTREYPTLRSHKTRIALFKKWRGLYKLNRTETVEYSGERTRVPELVGKLCPDIVYPNYQDHDYAAVILDKKSLKNIESSLATIQDPFLRSVLWSDLWRMVLNQRMDMSRFLEVAEFNGLIEKDLDTISKVFDSVSMILQKYFPDSGTPWRAQREVWVKFFEQAFITKIKENITDSEAQKVWFKQLVNLAESDVVLWRLAKAIGRGSSDLPLSQPLDQDMRWDIIARLLQFNHPEAEALLAKESQRDSSKRGQLNALYGKTLRPDIENKQNYFNELVDKRDSASLAYLRTIMYGLFPDQQKALHKKFADSYYTVLKKISKTTGQFYSTLFARTLVPAFCDKKSSSQISNFMEAEKGLSFPIVKSLRRALFENERCYEMRKILKDTGRPSMDVKPY